MIVQCPKCKKVRIDPATVREVLDNGVTVEAWATPLEEGGKIDVSLEPCPFCRREECHGK